MISIIKTFKHLLKKYRLALIIAVISMIIVDLMSYIIPIMIQYTIDNVFTVPDGNKIIKQSLIYGGIIIGLGLVRGFIVYIMIRNYWYIAESFTRDLRNKLYEKLQYLSAKFYAKSRTGDLMSRLTTDIQLLRNFFAFGIEHRIRIVLLSGTIFILMLIQNWKLALVVYSFIPFVYFIIIHFSNKLRAAVMQKHKQAGVLSSRIQENLRGIRIIKAFSMEEEEKLKFDKENNKMKKSNFLVGVLQMRLEPFLIVTSSVGTLVVLLYGGFQIIEKQMSIGVMMAFMTYLMTMRFPLMITGFNISTISLAQGAAKRVNEILELDDQRSETNGDIKSNLKGSVKFKNVSFGYDENKDILKNINFSIEAGEHVAIFGLTGSGKSSLISLIPRFYYPSSGEILLDDINLNSWNLEYIRTQVSIVLQETFLFSDSIRENISFGCPDASFEEVKNAAKSAKIHDYIVELPDAYNTIIGEYGVGLSGGQRQRIAIARAILRNPKILILDDCTSSLDPVTEKEIQNELRELMKGRTTIIIAQRISSLQLADRIVVIDYGEVKDFDSHDELIKKNKLYRDTYEAQMLHSTNEYCEDSICTR